MEKMEEKEIYYVVKVIEIDENTKNTKSKFYLVPGDFYGFAEEIQSNSDRIESHFSLILIKVASAGSFLLLPPELASESVIEKVKQIDEFYRKYVEPYKNLEDMKYYDIDTLRPVEFRVSYPDAKHKIVEYVEDEQIVRVEKYHLVERCYQGYIRKEEECEEEYILESSFGKGKEKFEKGSILRSIKSGEGKKIVEKMMDDIIEEVIFNNHDIVIELTPDKRKPLIRIEWKGLWGECKEDKIDGYRYGMGPLSEWACNIMNLWPRFKQMLIKE